MFQKLIAAGYLGADPESRVTPNGKSVTNFRVAVGKDDRTEWLSCTAWEKTAELVNQYLRKGSPVLIEGRLKTRKWQDKQGNDRYTTEVVVERVQFLPDGKGANGGNDIRRGGNDDDTEASRQVDAAADGDWDDDLPPL